MKLPGSEVHIHLPSWPDGFDVNALLHEGVYIKIEKKTGNFFVRVGAERGDGA